MSCVTGTKIKLTVFGESHGEETGIVIDGLPAGVTIDDELITAFLDRRKSDGSIISTARSERDIYHISSGIIEGKTCGTPLCATFKNIDVHSEDYDNIKYLPRPGHADYTNYVKYSGYNDYRGGGNSSGRMTLPLCFAGAILIQVLKSNGIEITSHIKSIKDIKDSPFDKCNPTTVFSNNKFPLIDNEKEFLMKSCITEAFSKNDSVGGTIECAVIGLTAGIGSPIFDSLESKIASLIFSIPGVKGIEFGNGFDSTEIYGSENNDEFIIEENKIKTKTNNNGGINGGISNGMPIVFNVAIKPTPSIGIKQKTVNLKNMAEDYLQIKGRHDPCIVPRAIPCIEAITAIALADLVI